MTAHILPSPPGRGGRSWWQTGLAACAVTVLANTPLDAQVQPGNPAAAHGRQEARLRADAQTLALVDDYQALGRVHEAWAAAQPLLRSPRLYRDRIVRLAELAVDANDPNAALALLARLKGGRLTMEGVAVEGRARLAAGHPLEALTALSSLSRDVLEMPAALALIDSTRAVSGLRAADRVASGFWVNDPSWSELLARQVVLAAESGDTARSERLLEKLDALDPTRARLAEAEIALAAGRPAQAIARLEIAPPGGWPDLADHLSAAALAQSGRLAAAIDTLSRLAHRRPSATAAIRLAEWRWRLHRNDDTRRAVDTLVVSTGRHGEALRAAARVRLAEDRPLDAVALFEPELRNGTLPLESLALVAEAFRRADRPARGLELLEARVPTEGAPALLMAALTAEVRGTVEGRRLLRTLAKTPAATPDVLTTWAEMTESAQERVQILRDAARRFPLDAGVALALEQAQRHAGTAGRETAAPAVALAALDTSVWVPVDALAAR